MLSQTIVTCGNSGPEPSAPYARVRHTLRQSSRALGVLGSGIALLGLFANRRYLCKRRSSNDAIGTTQRTPVANEGEQTALEQSCPATPRTNTEPEALLTDGTSHNSCAPASPADVPARAAAADTPKKAAAMPTKPYVQQPTSSTSGDELPEDVTTTSGLETEPELLPSLEPVLTYTEATTAPDDDADDDDDADVASTGVEDTQDTQLAATGAQECPSPTLELGPALAQVLAKVAALEQENQALRQRTEELQAQQQAQLDASGARLASLETENQCLRAVAARVEALEAEVHSMRGNSSPRDGAELSVFKASLEGRQRGAVARSHCSERSMDSFASRSTWRSRSQRILGWMAGSASSRANAAANSQPPTPGKGRAAPRLADVAENVMEMLAAGSGWSAPPVPRADGSSSVARME